MTASSPTCAFSAALAATYWDAIFNATVQIKTWSGSGNCHPAGRGGAVPRIARDPGLEYR